MRYIYIFKNFHLKEANITKEFFKKFIESFSKEKREAEIEQNV